LPESWSTFIHLSGCYTCLLLIWDFSLWCEVVEKLNSLNCKCCLHLNAWPKLVNPLSRWWTYMAGKLVSTVDKRCQLFTIGSFEYFHDRIVSSLCRKLSGRKSTNCAIVWIWNVPQIYMCWRFGPWGGHYMEVVVILRGGT
jgi:hypothetical protein